MFTEEPVSSEARGAVGPGPIDVITGRWTELLGHRPCTAPGDMGVGWVLSARCGPSSQLTPRHVEAAGPQKSHGVSEPQSSSLK